MEKRLSRFMKNRRSHLAESIDENTLARTSMSTSPPVKKQHFFSSQIRALTAQDGLVDAASNSDTLRSFSYDSCATGAPPTFITTAPAGNGPVKLQVNRRLSSGELVATTQEGALKDIREGQYVVGRKERPRSRGQRNSSRISSTTTVNRSLPASPASPTPTTPNSQRAWTNVKSSKRSHSIPYVILESSGTERSSGPLGLGLTTSKPSHFSYDFANIQRALGSQSSLSHESLVSEKKSPSQDASATFVALKKAEYSRMTGLYGPEAAALNLAKTSSSPSSPVVPNVLSPSPTLLQIKGSLVKGQDSTTAARRLSAASESCYNDSTGTSSSQRASYVSSGTGSSVVTGPSGLSEEDCVAIREDIKNVVEQIRSSYLDALETHSPPSRRTKSRKKRTVLKPTNTSAAANGNKNKSNVPPGRQTWHPENSQSNDASCRRRINSQPTNPAGRLSPIPASPTRTSKDLGIKRADSTTLGELMADMTRAQIKEQRASNQREISHKRNFSRPTTPRIKHAAKDSWLGLDSDTSPGLIKEAQADKSRILVHSRIVTTPPSKGLMPQTPSVPRGDFEELCQDLFGKDADSLWTSSSVFSSKNSTFTLNSDNSSNQWNQLSTPRKHSRITAIPESPEYTHLADPRCPEGHFI